MKHFDIRKGVWPGRADTPAPDRIESVAVGSAALLGADMPGLRPRFEVEEGALVGEGQVVFRNRKHPSVVYVAPIAGRVSTLAYGPRRTLSACVITAEGAPPEAQATVAPDAECHAAPRATLLERGLWPAFRTRPFGRTPDPDSSPDAIFVNAVRAAPMAPDPSLVLDDQIEAFHLGIRLVTKLTGGDVFVCQSPGVPIGPSAPRVSHASFSGSLAAGLAGTHVDRLCPVGAGRVVWTIGYQDVAAIGHLFLTGRHTAQRVVAIGGSGDTRAQLVKTSLGAGISELLGHAPLLGNARFLGRYEDQVTVPQKPKASPMRSWVRYFTPPHSALIPTTTLERGLAVEIPPIPLLRALSVGDSEAAERLGCLALVEEDMTALSQRCTSGTDYAMLLRGVLDELMAEAV